MCRYRGNLSCRVATLTPHDTWGVVVTHTSSGQHLRGHLLRDPAAGCIPGRLALGQVHHYPGLLVRLPGGESTVNSFTRRSFTCQFLHVAHSSVASQSSCTTLIPLSNAHLAKAGDTVTFVAALHVRTGTVEAADTLWPIACMACSETLAGLSLTTPKLYPTYDTNSQGPARCHLCLRQRLCSKLLSQLF